MIFEYQCIAWTNPRGKRGEEAVKELPEWVDWLNVEGLNGWELVNVVKTEGHNISTFKRRKDN